MACFILHSNQPSARRLASSLSRLSRYTATNAVADTDILLRWGSSDESDPPLGLVVNAKNAVERIASRVSMARFLRGVGIRVANRTNKSEEATAVSRQYRIAMFDLQPIACFRSDSGATWTKARISRVHASFQKIGVDEDRQTRRVVLLATRTLHALGLDFGLISIGASQRGLLQVMDVSATPVLDAQLLAAYKSALSDFMDREEQQRRNPATSVTLGTDVEVMLRNAQGKMVLASNYFTRHGRVGCDDRSVQFDGKRLPLMELRPDPETTPNGLLVNLRSAMLEASEHINRSAVVWRAGSMPFRPYCTGGHVHFSGIPLSARFVRALDNYLGLPLMAVEDQQTASRRRPKYGALGDVRQKEYGGFEYRTPASFVCSREATVAAIHLAHFLAINYRDLPISDIYHFGTQTAFYGGQTQVLRPHILRNIETIRHHVAYSQYREYLEPLFTMIEQGRTWDESRDVRIEWDVPVQRAKRAAGKQRQRRKRAVGS